MDAFESIVSQILWRDGYWVQPSFKVALTREEKTKIGRPTTPRWEIDIVGYCAKRNELLMVECKSFLDSIGVEYSAFNGGNEKRASRFKLFNDAELRDVVKYRLTQQLLEAGLIQENPSIKLALVCGKIVRDRDRELLRDHFARNEWLFWDEAWLKEKLRAMSISGYENSVAAVVAKLLLRG